MFGMAYLDGGMIYSQDNGTSISTNMSINDCLPGHLDSALMKVFYTDISDPFNPVNDSILFPLDSVRVNDYYLLKSSDIVRFAGAVRVDKITLDIPRHFVSYIDSTTYNVNRGQSLLFYYNWHWGLFKAIENPISVNYDINYALESVSIDGEGRILQHRTGDSVTYSYDYYLKDHLGSTRMVINDQNSITEKVAYQAYGAINPLDSSSPALPSREKFTGKEFDTQGADFARVEFDIAVRDFDMSSGSGFIRASYKDVTTGNSFSKIYKTRYDSKNRSLRFTGSESFTGEVEIEQMFLMASGVPGGIFNIVPIDSFLVSVGKTRKIQLDVASSEIIGTPIDTNLYSVHASVDNRSYFSGTRLFYFGARYYDPELGIWLSVDPEEEYWNAYLYCGADPINYYDPDGLWTFGLGLVFGYDKEHGFRVGVGAAMDFKEETGFGFGANLYSAYNADGSWTHTASINASADYYGLEGHIGAGYTYNTHTGTTLSGYIGGSYQSYGGVELGGSLFWNKDGNFQGGTAYAEGFVGPTYAHIAGGYEWGSGQMEGRGWYGEAATPIAQGGYSQNQGWYYGAQVNQKVFEYNSASGQWGYVGPKTRSDFVIAAPLLYPALEGVIYVGSAILAGIAGHIALKKAEKEIKGGHESNIRPSTKGKHQKADTRRKRDQGNEKGDAKRKRYK